MSNIVNNTLDGGLCRNDPVHAVSGLSSLFTVCALALSGVQDHREDIRERALEEIKHAMVLFSLAATDAADIVDRALDEAKKGGAA